MRAPRSFERRMFVSLLAVALIPTAVVGAAGYWILGDVLARSGSAGPWAAVEASGSRLAAEVERSWPADQPLPDGLAEAVVTHREALAESARMSRLYAAVAARALERLPAVALLMTALVAGLAFLTARLMARAFARPTAELVDWTRLIAAGEALPVETRPSPDDEFSTLRGALRTMSAELAEGRRREVEAARLSAWSATARRVAHEVKNMLTPMKMAAHQLQRAKDPGSSVTVLLEEIDRLDALARAFAQVGRAPEGPLAPVDVGELAQELVEQYGRDAVPATIELGEGPLLVMGHLEALRAAIRNLLANAVESCEEVRFEGGTPVPGVRVAVSRGPADTGMPTVILVVEDDGAGIPDGLGDSIWDLDVTTKHRGSGVGLALVRQTVAAHGGQVAADNRAGGGARFRLEIPAAPSPQSGS